MADGFTEVMNTTAEEVLGRVRRVLKPWSNEKLVKKCEERRKLKTKRYESEESKMAYKIADDNVKAEIKKTKEKWINDHCDQIQNGFELSDVA